MKQIILLIITTLIIGNRITHAVPDMRFSEDASGSLIMKSANGRYVFSGQLIDRWSDTYLKDIDSLQKSSSTIMPSSLPFDLDDISPFSFGLADETKLFVFFDPVCPACKRFLSMIPHASNTRIVLIPVSVFPESRAFLTALACSNDVQDTVSRILRADYDSMDVIHPDYCPQRSLHLAKLWSALPLYLDIDRVPFLIRADGATTVGIPTDINNWIY